MDRGREGGGRREEGGGRREGGRERVMCWFKVFCVGSLPPSLPLSLPPSLCTLTHTMS